MHGFKKMTRCINEPKIETTPLDWCTHYMVINLQIRKAAEEAARRWGLNRLTIEDFDEIS